MEEPTKRRAFSLQAYFHGADGHLTPSTSTQNHSHLQKRVHTGTRFMARFRTRTLSTHLHSTAQTQPSSLPTPNTAAAAHALQVGHETTVWFCCCCENPLESRLRLVYIATAHASREVSWGPWRPWPLVTYLRGRGCHCHICTHNLAGIIKLENPSSINFDRMSEKEYAPLSSACVRALNDKIYEKRKAAALEIEKLV